MSAQESNSKIKNTAVSGHLSRSKIASSKLENDSDTDAKSRSEKIVDGHNALCESSLPLSPSHTTNPGKMTAEERAALDKHLGDFIDGVERGRSSETDDPMAHGSLHTTDTESEESDSYLAYGSEPGSPAKRSGRSESDPNLAYGELPPRGKSGKTEPDMNLAYGDETQIKPESANNLISGDLHKGSKPNEDSPEDADDEWSPASETHSGQRWS